MAHQDEDTVVVYQAYNKGIADYAVENKKFIGGKKKKKKKKKLKKKKLKIKKLKNYYKLLGLVTQE